MTVLSMSRTEIDRLHVLRDVIGDRISARDAAQLMRVTPRQVFRLLKLYRADGPSALLSKRRGQPSNRSYPPIVRTEALALIKANYADFGPTLAAEKLAERHGLHFGVETVRRWMLAEGLWKDRRQRLKPVHQPRHRRDCVGELIQIDGSEHWWFEERGPQGRVERANLTLQDRLVKELRLAGISTMEAGNAFLPAFMEDYNRRFAKTPFSDKDVHRPLAAGDDLDDIFAWKEERTVSNSLTLQYDKVLFILEPNEVTRPLARQRVTIFDYPDGRFVIKHKGRELPYRIFDKVRQVDQAAIVVVENKHLGAVLAYVAERQKQLGESRSKKAPRRGGQAKSIFKVG